MHIIFTQLFVSPCVVWISSVCLLLLSCIRHALQSNIFKSDKFYVSISSDQKHPRIHQSLQDSTVFVQESIHMACKQAGYQLWNVIQRKTDRNTTDSNSSDEN
jgi:hypothetical protein